jgi:membrane protein DedA with SNARE-associated domain
VLDRLITIVSQLGHWSYLFIFLAVTLESSAFLGFLVPGESFVLFGGFLAAQGTLDLGTLMALVCGGAILGDTIGYEMGHFIGVARLLRAGRWFGLRQKHLDYVHEFFRRHGGKAVVFGRLTALLRALTPFVAGSSGMPYSRFLLYNAAGGIAWGVTFALIGYFVGANWRIAEHWISRGGLVVGGLAVLLIAKAWFWRRGRQKLERDSRALRRRQRNG